MIIFPKVSEIAKSSLELDIFLPKEEKFTVSDELDSYGFRTILVSHYGRRATRKPLAAWLHSWKYWELRTDLGIASGIKRKQVPVLVPTRGLQAQLLRLNYKIVELAPSPWALATAWNNLPIPKRNFRLLCVIPKRNIGEVHQDTSKYLDFVVDSYPKLKPVILVPASYRSNRDFIQMLRQRGLSYVIGPSGDDRNGLTRMSQIFRNFEYVISGHFGTHLPFAAINGCKVGIIGPYIEAIDSRNEWYSSYRDLISEVEMKKKYRDIFCDSLDTLDPNKTFFEEESGYGLINNEFVWARIAKLMGWTLGGLFVRYSSKILPSFYAR